MLNEEEKKAIEQLKSWREYIIKNKEKVNKANDLEFYLRILLNFITKLQKENERYKKLYQKALDNTISADRENIQLKKQIDLQIEFIYKMWCDYPGSVFKKLKNEGFDDSNCGLCEYSDRNCKICIKQHFEKLAKEKGE